MWMKIRNLKTRLHLKMIIAAVMIIFVCVSAFSLKTFATASYWELEAEGTTLASLKTENEAERTLELLRGMYVTGEQAAEGQVDVQITPAVKLVRKEYFAYRSPDFASPEVAAAAASKKVDVRVSVQTTKDVVIPHGTKTKGTDSIQRGKQKVTTAGQDGTKRVTSEVVSVNGKYVSTQVISQTTLQPSVTKKVLKGTGLPHTGAEVAAYALKFRGNPYVYGGESLTHGADCSGFTMKIYEKFGIKLPHGAFPQAYYGRHVGNNPALARPGDLIIFRKGHCGIAIGDGKMIHASSPSSGIIVTDITYSGAIRDIRRFF